MKRLLFLLLVFVCSVSYGQTYQSMPQAGYGPVQRMLFDSVVTLPMGITRLRNISGGRDTAQIRYNKTDSSIYVYTGSQWVKSSGSGGSTIDTTSLSNRINLKLNIIDTINQFVSSVSQPNDSSLTFVKGSTASTYIIRSSIAASATRMVTSVYNKSGATILKGAVIYIDGAHSSILPSIALSKANTEETSAYTFAIVDADIPNNSQGVVVQIGVVTGLNLPTSSYTDGQTLYLSPTVAGGYTTTKPLAPNHYVAIGTVIRAHPTQGTIQVAIRNGFQLDEMSDVQIPLVPNDSTVLQFSRVDSLWHAVSPTNVIGGYGWKTSGNSDVNAGRFIGSTNNASLRFKTNNTETMILDSVGKLKVNGFANNATSINALQLSNTNNRAFFNVNTNSSITELSFKPNNNAVLDSMVINDTGLIQPRQNQSLWLKAVTSSGLNVVANRCAACGTGNIFSASAGTSAPIFNVTSTGATSIGASSAAASSLVDMSSTSLGLLIPRMTTTQRDAISSPSSQLLVSNTTKKTLDQYNGTTWNSIAGDYNKDLLGLQALGSPVKSSPIGTAFMPATGSSLVASRSYFNAIIVEKEITITGAMWYQSTQGVYIGTGGNYNGIALYSQSGGTLTLIDSTARDTTIWKASNATWNQKAFAGGSRTLQPGVYYLLALANPLAGTFGTAPVIGSWQSLNLANSMSTNSAKLYGGIVNTVTVPPTTQAMSAWNNFSFYFSLYLY
jgi:hypothetical protein